MSNAVALDDLLAFVRINNRVCPQPVDRAVEAAPGLRQMAAGAEMPPTAVSGRPPHAERTRNGDLRNGPLEAETWRRLFAWQSSTGNGFAQSA